MPPSCSISAQKAGHGSPASESAGRSGPDTMGDESRAQMFPTGLAEDERADLCIDCGECLEKCPQMIEIPEWLAKAHDVLCQAEPA
jgi:ferredoxin